MPIFQSIVWFLCSICWLLLPSTFNEGGVIMCLLGVRQRFGSGVIREGGTCARENIYRSSLRSAKADISSTLDTVTTINKLDTINTPETFTSTLNTLTTSHYNYYIVLIMAAGCSFQNAQTPVMLLQNLTQTYFK